MRRTRPPAAALHASPDELEAQFYEALQRGDIALLMSVWADDDEIVCVHPGGGRLVGAAAIRESFEAIFGNAPVPATPQSVHRLQGMGCEVHHLVERVEINGPQGRHVGFAMATNVFVKTAQGWRMAAHHASPVSPEDATAGDSGPATIH